MGRKTILTVPQATKMLLNRMRMDRGPDGVWTSRELGGLLKQWDVRRSRRSSVVRSMVLDGSLVREAIENREPFLLYRYRLANGSSE